MCNMQIYSTYVSHIDTFSKDLKLIFPYEKWGPDIINYYICIIATLKNSYEWKYDIIYMQTF